MLVSISFQVNVVIQVARLLVLNAGTTLIALENEPLLAFIPKPLEINV